MRALSRRYCSLKNTLRQRSYAHVFFFAKERYFPAFREQIWIVGESYEDSRISFESWIKLINFLMLRSSSTINRCYSCLIFVNLILYRFFLTFYNLCIFIPIMSNFVIVGIPRLFLFLYFSPLIRGVGDCQWPFLDNW